MPFVVVDTNVALPATLRPSGLARRFWVVLALGALTYEVEHRQLELGELEAEAKRQGGVVRGVSQAQDRIAEVEERRSALLELLPYGVPDDWVAIGSAPLFDEYERKLREVGKKLDPALRDDDIPRLRRQLEAVCIAGSPPFDPDAVPHLTADRKDDAILYTALIGGADFLVADDKHLVPNRHEHVWEHEENLVTAVTFNTLISERLDAESWIGDIEGSWLQVAHG